MANRRFLLVFVLMLLATPGFSQSAETRAKQFYIEDSYAIDGYDLVAYLTEEKAKEGKKAYAVTHEGVTYLFSTEQNKTKFMGDPEKYLPAYGGWCAYALAENGKKMKPDPETFKIQDGRLYLFYNSFFNNTLPKWNKKPSEMKNSADKVWAGMLKQ